MPVLESVSEEMRVTSKGVDPGVLSDLLALGLLT